jgi:hypothetical protein
MIDQYNADRTGWARFSDDMAMRYRLARSLTSLPLTVDELNGHHISHMGGSPARRVVFLMLNPSTADAFKPDPTIGECRKRAVALGADVLEVVNLFALRSPYPADLKKRAHGFRGDDALNDEAILAACAGAYRVVSAWGNHGALDHRAAVARRVLVEHGIALHHLGLTKEGFPKHPLARGKHRIAANFVPQEWTA